MVNASKPATKHTANSLPQTEKIVEQTNHKIPNRLPSKTKTSPAQKPMSRNPPTQSGGCRWQKKQWR